MTPSNHFRINEITMRYCREFHNDAWANERSLEVALGRWFLALPTSNIWHQELPGGLATQRCVVTEVGAVMPYYDDTTHQIYDLADEHVKSTKANAIGLDYAGRDVLSISTIEHLSTREYGNASDEDSITFLRKVVDAASRYLITWGIGYNPTLDAYVKAHPEIPRLIMKRTNWKNEWIQHLDSNDFTFPFGHSDKPIPQGYYNNANGVCIVTNVPELLPRANPYHAFFKQNEAARDKVFHEVCAQFAGKPVSILEIGAARDIRAESRFGDGWSTMFWAEYIEKNGGAIKVVDVDPRAIECCKTLTSYYADKIDIKYLLDDGYNHIGGDYTLVYLDGSDDPNEMLKQFEAIKPGTLVLMDDAHVKGTAVRAKYLTYRLFKCNKEESHEMTLYVR